MVGFTSNYQEGSFYSQYIIKYESFKEEGMWYFVYRILFVVERKFAIRITAFLYKMTSPLFAE